MGSIALGKGMRDLIAKSASMNGARESKPDETTLKEELKVNIERYSAQGFNVERLTALRDRTPKEIVSGMERYREDVKRLTKAMTVLKSFEGYGYTKEMEHINSLIKDPSKVDEVLEHIEDLRERTTLDRTPKPQKEAPKVKLPESLKAASERLAPGADGGEQAEPERPQEKQDPGTSAMELNDLDGLMNDLNELGEVFSEPQAPLIDPMMIRIEAWEAEGYFVDRLKNILVEDRDLGATEVDRFEAEIKEIEALKKRFSEMDLSAFATESERIRIKFKYPHLWKEIENELDRIETIQKQPPVEERQTLPESPVPEPVAPAPEAVETPSAPIGEVVLEKAPPVEAEGIATASPDGTVAAQEVVKEAPKIPSMTEGLTNEELMEKAKEAYTNGRMEESLILFKEILERDPENSKARFMLRRISSKL